MIAVHALRSGRLLWVFWRGFRSCWTFGCGRFRSGGVADLVERRADGDVLALFGEDTEQVPGDGRRDLNILVTDLDLDDTVIAFDDVAFVLEPSSDRPLRDRPADCRHLHGRRGRS